MNVDLTDRKDKINWLNVGEALAHLGELLVAFRRHSA